MQPEPSAVPQTSSPESIPQNSVPSYQYGIHDRDGAVSQPSGAAEEGASVSEREQRALNAALAASLQEEHGANRLPSGRLSARETPSPPSRNRISEYESASTPLIKKRVGPGFEVIKNTRQPGDMESPISGLPNEVLTHALAHLAPADLTSVSLVSNRFHALVTTPHAWRSAFSRYFPGPDSIHFLTDEQDDSSQDLIRTERRAFTRLTALASWRSEYIIRTRLLRSLTRGKPVQAIAPPSSARSGQSHTAIPDIRYNSELFTTVNHLHATFGTGLNKRFPRFIHGADDVGTASSSDPNAGKVDSWGFTDPQVFLQFAERFPGDAQYGLGPGDVVGVPNGMDVSQQYGMIHGEGSPAGMAYYRSTEEMRGRFLTFSSAMSVPELGIPKIQSKNEAMCCVWIAKSSTIPSLTDGLVGMLSGTSLGVLTAYSLGSSTSSTNRDQRFGRGEMTARWVLSPGVPLIAIAIDDQHSLKRQAQNRIWAVVLNALGEVFYVTKFPKRPHVDRGTRLNDEALERVAWQTGRSIYWNVVEPSRRTARPDPYAEARVDGSYSPRSSWNGMCLSNGQVQAETREIEAFVARKPRDFQKVCLGWDMRRRIEVDFAGDDENIAGEAVVIIDCGLEENSTAAIKRYKRCRFEDRPASNNAATMPPLTNASTESTSASLFGGSASPVTASQTAFSFDTLDHALSQDLEGSITPRPMIEEWRTSTFTFDDLKTVQITTSGVDGSNFATITTSEDPLLGFSGLSTASSPSATPMSPTEGSASPADVPGQRARLMAAGTATGCILLWNMRAPTPRSTEMLNTVEPVRIIYTESPQISCLALSALYLVSGGNDGLVQTWDPLASTMQPIRTLNSRFSSRARRRLVQAQASPQGVGINLFAAGALCLDPDPTVLRGMVSLGTHLRYWSYSSSAADQYKSHKRRSRRSERGSNNGGERFSGAARGNLKDYIANEKSELEREKDQRRKEAQRFAGRFGTELLGDASEEDMIAYAALLSQESLQHETERRASDTSTAVSTSVSSADNALWSSDTPMPADSPALHIASPKTDEEFDADVAEAIRFSLTSDHAAAFDIPMQRTKQKGWKTPSPRSSPPMSGASVAGGMTDLEFAMKLSLAEEQSKRVTGEGEAFPALSAPGGSTPSGGRGKGKGRAA